MSSSSASYPLAAPLSKKERGRLKKLRKRAVCTPITTKGREVSGLTCRSDYEEYERLQQRAQHEAKDSNDNTLRIGWMMGPCVIPRRGQHITDDWQRADAEDHRNVLWNWVSNYLVNTTSIGVGGVSHKRPREDDLPAPPSIPPWATLHNPWALKSVAVVEVHVETGQYRPTSGDCGGDDEDDDDSLWWQEHVLSQLPSLSVGSNTTNRTCLPVWTRWFQSDRHLKTPSDELLCLPKKSFKEQNQEPEGEGPPTIEGLPTQFEPLLLSASKRASEGYPMQLSTQGQDVSTEGGKSDGSSRVSEKLLPEDTARLPHLIPQNEAETIVQRYQVAVENLEGDDPQELGTFVATQVFSRAVDATLQPRVFALDCEMVRTTVGSQLARTSLIQLTGISSHDKVTYEIVLDELSKPSHQVVDYLTPYSGMTAAKLQPVTTSLMQVQASVLSCVDARDVLVGHSLENDLLALRIVHHRVVDTAMLFRAKNGRKYSLRHLSATLLGKRIQMNGSHCSEEDAAAALHLAVRRAREGPPFCIRERGDEHWHLLEQPQLRDESPVVCIGPHEWLKAHITSGGGTTAHALTCESVHDTNRKALVAWTSSSKRRARFVWMNLAVPEKNHVTSLSMVNQTLSDLFASMLPGTVVLVVFQRGYQRAADLISKRKAMKDPRSSLRWSADDEKELAAALDVSRSGVAYWISDSSCST